MKRNILLVIVTAIICISGTVFAYAYNASDVGYKNTNVSDALDDLYDKSSKYDSLTFYMSVDSSTNNEVDSVFNFPNTYKHFKVLKIVHDANINTCTIKGWNVTTSSNVDIVLNQEYDILNPDNLNLMSLLLYKTNAVNNTWGRCSAQIMLYN